MLIIIHSFATLIDNQISINWICHTFPKYTSLSMALRPVFGLWPPLTGFLCLKFTYIRRIAGWAKIIFLQSRLIGTKMLLGHKRSRKSCLDIYFS